MGELGRPEGSAGPDGLNGPCGRKEEWGPGLDLRLGFWARGKSRPGWAASGVLGWVGLGFFFLLFSFLNLIQTKFEFKFEFEFKPHSNKIMHQHECNKNLNL